VCQRRDNNIFGKVANVKRRLLPVHQLFGSFWGHVAYDFGNCLVNLFVEYIFFRFIEKSVHLKAKTVRFVSSPS
jgi:hypothetical protein